MSSARIITYKAKDSFQRKHVTKRVKSRHKGKYPWEHTHDAEITHVSHNVQLEIAIDWPSLIRRIASTVIFNKNKRTQLLSGVIKAKLVRDDREVLRVEERPLPEEYEPIEPPPEESAP